VGVILFLVVATPTPSRSKVLNSPTFTGGECEVYFYGGIEPQGFEGGRNMRRICQCYKDTAYFATLYDQDRRIPLYSAYVYGKNEGSRCGRNVAWCIEPQLTDQNENDNLEKSPSENAPGGWFNKVRDFQAVDQDYKHSGYTRGHVNPNGHHKNEGSRSATFTFTNIIPQPEQANQEWARGYETKMETLTAGCSETYVITGASPGDQSLRNRVNIPDYIWSAFCCVDNNGRPMKSGAHILHNVAGEKVIAMSLASLQLELNINIFKNDCQ
uniref:Uncharacterized protein n=1 Tax=Latimeria chalumnae TaxID=7897 RepID=H2ZXV4_LATCH